jgi:hypothetical protein
MEPAALRMAYTHPMDDGQERTFKVKLEGEWYLFYYKNIPSPTCLPEGEVRGRVVPLLLLEYPFTYLPTRR